MQSREGDFVIVGPHPAFELRRTGREEFAKVFFYKSVLSSFEWQVVPQ
jgi:hypothetical protein